MYYTPFRVAVLASAVLAASAASAGEIRGLDQANVIPNRYIVVYKQDQIKQKNGRLRAASAVAGDLKKSYGGVVEHTYDRVLKGAVVTMDYNSARKLADDPRVAFVEADGIMRANATQTGATWGIDRIDQVSLPLDGSYTYAASSGVHAYIIDTGILSTHTQFTGRIGTGYDAVSDGNGTTDCNGHGTHVAGTVGGTTYGVAKSVTLHPVRVLGCDGSGTNSGVIAGMEWVASNAVKPAVANMSLGGSASTAIDNAIATLTSAGVVTVVAAGNDSGNACSYSPARASSAITVGSTTSSDAMSSFSNYGTCVDIFAPGSSITSSYYTSTTATSVLSGTSMASPHVAGAAALYLYANPSATPAQVSTALVANAASDKLTGITSGPNKLLCTAFLNGGSCSSGSGGGGTTQAEIESNNSRTTANAVSTSGTTVSGTISSSSDTDYFSVSVPAGTTLTATLTPNSSADYDLYIYNSSGTQLASSTNSTGVVDSTSVSNSGSSAVTRYVRVKYYSGTSGTSGTYTLKLSW